MSRTVIYGERIKKTLSRNKKLRYMASQKSLVYMMYMIYGIFGAIIVKVLWDAFWK